MVETALIEEYFNHLLSLGICGQTFIFTGPQDSGKQEFCLQLAKKILQTTNLHHPDLLIFRPQGKLALHSIEEMRRVCDEAKRTPHLAKNLVIIIEEAEKMTLVSSNALLKTFEEPNPWCLIFLISSHPDLLLPTLLSRCKEINFSKEPNSSATSPFVEKLLNLLAEGPKNHYFDLKKAISELIEIAPQESFSYTEQLTPYQKTQLEKNYEGQEALKLQETISHLFNALTSWYRDLCLLAIDPHIQDSLLFFPEKKTFLFHALKEKRSLPLTLVTSSVEEALLALSRSNPLQSTLEALFLKLQFIKSPDKK